jgi:hypothetical protein
MAERPALRKPSRGRGPDGAERRVGVEIELSGMSFSDLVTRLSDYLGGEAGARAYYEIAVDTPDGAYLAELDSAPVKALDDYDRSLPEPLAQLRNGAKDLFEAAAERVVPLEVVTPALPFSRLSRVNGLCDHLREHGALGSRHAVYFAFGCQLNPELPAYDGDTLLAYMRAFAGLYPWLRERQQLDFSRKLTTYISPWPRPYLELLSDPAYHPPLEQLIIDHLEYNPTRNRALDLLPLWGHLRPDILWQCVDDQRIKARPTLHYRLPDCDLDNPEWSFAHVWNDWVAVEALAADEARLKEFMTAFRRSLAPGRDNGRRDWVEECEQWVRAAFAPSSG